MYKISLTGRWSISNGGLTYKFNNGATVTATGSLSNGGSVGIKFQKKFGDEMENDSPLEDADEAANTCRQCLAVQPIKIYDHSNEKKTLARNGFVMIVRFIDEAVSLARKRAIITFKVIKILKSPLRSVKKGNTFTIRADMAKCQCLKKLDPGYYVVKGSMNKKKQLVLSNVLMEFQK